MSKKPYPGYSPNYTQVDKTGGYQRTCIVLELLSQGQLTAPHMALVQEQIEALLERLQKQIPYLEKSDVVLSDRFDPVLRKGLRLP